MIPSRGLLLVRPVDSAERFAGGVIVIPADARERLTANQFEVVSVGAFAECDDEECERRHVHDSDLSNQHPTLFHSHPVIAGDWILVSPRSAIDGPDPEHPARFVHQDAVLGIFNSTEA